MPVVWTVFGTGFGSGTYWNVWKDGIPYGTIQIPDIYKDDPSIYILRDNKSYTHGVPLTGLDLNTDRVVLNGRVINEPFLTPFKRESDAHLSIRQEGGLRFFSIVEYGETVTEEYPTSAEAWNEYTGRLGYPSTPIETLPASDDVWSQIQKFLSALADLFRL